ncbi:hypothetical protein GCM10022205_47060 [Spinactinospora alkalitolerans]
MFLGESGAHRDAGASITEYMAVILLVAAVAGAVVVTAVPARISEGIRNAICRVLQSECVPSEEDQAQGDPDEDFHPTRCEVYQTQDKAGYSLYVAIFKFGEEYAFMEQQMADGSYRLTLMPHNAEIGVEGKLFQIKGEGGRNFQLGGEAKIGAYFKAGVGDTWVFEDEAEAQSFKDDIIENQMAMDAMARNPGAGIYYWINPPPEIPDPSMTTVTTRLEAGANAEAGVSVKTSEAEQYFNIGTGFTGKFRVGGQIAVRTDNRRPDDPDYPLSATTYQLDGQLGAGSEILGGGEENLHNWAGAVRVTRNSKGEPVEILYTTTVEESLVSKDRAGGNGRNGKGGAKDKDGDGILQETRTVIALDTPEERAVAEEYLRNEGLTGMPAIAFSQLFDDGDSLLTRPPPGASEFEELLYEQAWVSSIAQEKTTDAQSYGGKVALGVGLGLKISTESSQARTVESEFLGAPRPDGTRRFQEFPECLAEPQ